MRRAEFLMAFVMGVFSLYLINKSTELPIGWVKEAGPGGGAFPFWLSIGMLLCCIAIGARAWIGATPESRSTEPFMDRESFKLIGTAVGAITAMLVGIHIVGAYVAIPLFLLFYIRFVGRHTWKTTIAISAIAPVVTFLFFEASLKILLPKGITEPLFIPLYKIFLSS